MLFELYSDMWILVIPSAPFLPIEKIFSPRSIPIVPAASLLFTLFPSSSRMTAFWSFTHELRSRFVVCAIERACAYAWVCTTGAGNILISIQRRTILLARPLKDGNEGFSGSLPFPARPWRRQVGQVLRFFECSPKPWENYVNVAIPTICRETGTWKGWRNCASDRNATLHLTDVNICNLTK